MKCFAQQTSFGGSSRVVRMGGACGVWVGNKYR